MCLWTSSYTRTTSAFRYTKGTFWCLLSNLRDKNLKFTCGRFTIFLDCICTLQYRITTELKHWKLLLPYCYLKKNERHAVKWVHPITHSIRKPFIFFRQSSLPAYLPKMLRQTILVLLWDTGKNCLSSPTSPTRANFNGPAPSFFPSTAVCFHFYGSIADFHFNTLSSLDEQTASTRREPLWVSCNMLSTEKQKLNLKAAGEPLTTHSCSK